MDGGIQIIGSGASGSGSFPSVLRRPYRSSSPGIIVVDASDLSLERQNLLRNAADGTVTFNFDHLLYHPGNDKNWGRISSDPKRDGADEMDSIARASQAHALIVQPPQKFVFGAIGAADKFLDKERIVWDAHLEQGHQFDTAIFIDINKSLLERAISDAEAYQQEKGLQVNNIGIVGDAFSREVSEKFKEIAGEQEVLLSVFGLTVQNIDNKVTGYSEASDQLTSKLRAVKRLLPKGEHGSRFFGTFNHETDRDSVTEKYTGPAHDDFIMSGVEHQLGSGITSQLEIRRTFQGSTSILYRDVVAKHDFAVKLTKDETRIIRKGAVVWSGISAPLPKQYVSTAFEDAKLYSVMDPVVHGAVACHVVHRRP